ncbi:MAG: LEA type 2 family protein [Treponema sp.]|jgi:LEA14-like dessication related protein|nr:LEA type 2 family protein [Treponema sp.]
MMKKTAAVRQAAGRRNFTAGVFVCAGFAVLAVMACQTVPDLVSEPVISFDSVSLEKINFDGVGILAKINVENPNPFSIPLPGIDWELFIADEMFLGGSVKTGQGSPSKLAAKSSTIVELPFTVPYNGLYSAAANLLDADEAPYRINISARFPIPVLGDKVFTAQCNGLVPLLKVPNLSFGGIKFNSLGPSKVELVLTWAVENRNAFAITLDSLDYDFALNNSSWARGRTPAGLNLPARRTTEIPVTVTINSLSLVKDMLALAGSGKNAAFSCAGEAALHPSFEGLEAFAIPFNFTGTTDFRNQQAD